MKMKSFLLLSAVLAVFVSCSAQKPFVLSAAGIEMMFPSEEWKIETTNDNNLEAVLSGTDVTIYISPLDVLDRELAIRQNLFSVTNSLQSAGVTIQPTMTYNGIDFFQFEFNGQTKGSPSVFLSGRAVVFLGINSFYSLILIAPVDQYRQFGGQIDKLMSTIRLVK